MDATHFRKSAAREAWLSAGAPILALVTLVIAAAFAVFINFANQQDRSFEDNSRRLVQNTLDGRLHGLADVTIEFTNWDDAYRATTLRWDEHWLANNFYSGVADALVIFRADGTVRYAWLADGHANESQTLPAQLVYAARQLPNFRDLIRAPKGADTVSTTLALIDGRLALVATAPITLEDDGERLERADTTNVSYLVSVQILTPAAIAQLGETLNLADLSLADTQAAFEARRQVALHLTTASTSPVGDLRWRNDRPGAHAFASQIGPVVLGLLLIGALAALVAHALVKRQVAAGARIEAALQSSRLKSDFIAAMSHELRTPLNAIIGYAELIQEDAPHERAFDTIREDVGRIAGAADNLRLLINNVLDQSRIDGGKLKLAPEAVKVVDILHEVDEQLAPAARERFNTLRVWAETPCLELVCDHQRLRQCLLNLGGNAIKFTRAGSVSISASACDVGGVKHVAFTVEDTGIGIAQGDADKLFQPFQQANEQVQLKYGGAGLGLSISRKLARAMGGDITFSSRLGKGSRFRLVVPMQAAAASAEDADALDA